MEKWLAAALDYIPQWIDFQMRLTGAAGRVDRGQRIKGKPVLRAGLRPCRRRRGRRPDAAPPLPCGLTLQELHRRRHHEAARAGQAAARRSRRPPRQAAASGRGPGDASAQLLSHSAGLIRDGTDAGQWQDRRPFLNARELTAALRAAPVLDANNRFKYSNHGYGLAGLVIEAVTGEPYADWIKRAIIDAGRAAGNRAGCAARPARPDGPRPQRASSRSAAAWSFPAST